MRRPTGTRARLDSSRQARRAVAPSLRATSVKALLQRVSKASVRVAGDTVGSIGPGLCVLVGVGDDDADDDAARLARRVPDLRLFEDDEGKTNRSLADTGGSVLAISQFTLLADTRRGRRPSFNGAARPDVAEPLFERFVAGLREAGVDVATGRFGAHMDLEISADGPLTILIDTKEARRA